MKQVLFFIKGVVVMSMLADADFAEQQNRIAQEGLEACQRHEGDLKECLGDEKCKEFLDMNERMVKWSSKAQQAKFSIWKWITAKFFERAVRKYADFVSNLTAEQYAGFFDVNVAIVRENLQMRGTEITDEQIEATVHNVIDPIRENPEGYVSRMVAKAKAVRDHFDDQASLPEDRSNERSAVRDELPTTQSEQLADQDDFLVAHVDQPSSLTEKQKTDLEKKK
jgi:hypothetical protein